MKPTFWQAVKAAFSLKPLGMFVAPNWLALAAFTLLGITINPGFFLLGAGAELTYLYAMASSPRFRRTLEGQQENAQQNEWQARVERMLAELSTDDRQRYRALELRCQSILDLQLHGNDTFTSMQNQSDGLMRLLSIYLRLLLGRRALRELIYNSKQAEHMQGSFKGRIEKLEKQLADETLPNEMRNSLREQIKILQQRQNQQEEAHKKDVFLEAELTRIHEQVELIREQVLLPTTDSSAVSDHINQVATTLDSTTQWMREEKQLLGAVEDFEGSPPPLKQMPARQRV
jgi:hypothetical protein